MSFTLLGLQRKLSQTLIDPSTTLSRKSSNLLFPMSIYVRYWLLAAYDTIGKLLIIL